MRAIVIDHRVSLVSDYRDPRPAGGEILVRVRLAGVCGTDLELARGYMSYRGVPGHEFVGEIAGTGRRVVGEINVGCGRCDLCRVAMDRHCPNRSVLGILNRDGAFADYLLLPERNLLLLPDSISDEVAVFTEPIAAAYEILEQVSISRNNRILVLGDGRLGAIIGLAFCSEGLDVTVGGHHADKIRLLNEIGIRALDERNTDERGFDVVIDATGNAAGLARAIEMARPCGTIVLKSTAAASGAMNLAPIVINEITVVGSRCGRFAPALAALASGKVDPRPLISATLPLEDGVCAFELAAQPSTFKVLLRTS